MVELTFVTSQPKKAAELALYLSFPVTHRRLNLPEIQSLDPFEVVTAKAQEAYRLVGSAVLVEDYSLRLEALGRLPGPLIKWFLDELGPERICRLLSSAARVVLQPLPVLSLSCLAISLWALFSGTRLDALQKTWSH